MEQAKKELLEARKVLRNISPIELKTEAARKHYLKALAKFHEAERTYIMKLNGVKS